MMTPITTADYANLMFLIEGARDYYRRLAAGKPASFDSVGVKVLDEHTLQVKLENPCGYFLELTAFPPFFPVYRPLLEKYPYSETPVYYNGITAYSEKWTDPDKIITNGPFLLKDHWDKQEMVLEKNPYYWDREHVALKRVRALAIEDVKASLHAYESGNCQYIDTVPIPAIRALLDGSARRKSNDFYRVTSFGTYFYRFNCQGDADGAKNPLADPRIRRALALAVDKVDIAAIAGGRQEPTDTFIPPGLTVLDRDNQPVAYKGPGGLKYDVAAAQKLLAQAGYPGGKGLPEIRLMYNAGYDHEKVAQRLQAMWQENLGIEVVFDVKDGGAFGQACKLQEHKEWHLSRGGWFGDYRDPTTFLDQFVTNDGNNDYGYSNPRFDEIMHQAAAELDQHQRMALYAQAEKIVLEDDAAVLPLYNYAEHLMIAPQVQGAWPNQMGYLILKQVLVSK